MSRKASADIGIRAFEEIDRLYPVHRRAAKAIGCAISTFQNWQCGHTPTPIFFQRLYYLGADITYILTGFRDSIPIELVAELRSNQDLLKVVQKVATLNRAQLNSLDNLLSSFNIQCGKENEK